MPNFNESSNKFKLSGNPFHKNFPGAFKQGNVEGTQQQGSVTDEELIERSKAQFGEGAVAETISKETFNKARDLGILTRGESGHLEYNPDNARHLMKQAGMGLDPKHYPEEAEKVKEINNVIKAFTGGKGYTGSKY
tara:strand:- start:32 stop:439 length:408 start_codon:yes stop_codon:yes gene_type:complete